LLHSIENYYWVFLECDLILYFQGHQIIKFNTVRILVFSMYCITINIVRPFPHILETKIKYMYLNINNILIVYTYHNKKSYILILFNHKNYFSPDIKCI